MAGVTVKAKTARLLLIPAGPETEGHRTQVKAERVARARSPVPAQSSVNGPMHKAT